ncbi:MAG: flagellar brake protein [Kangiellaceae bacterium]|jgi:hypothetical protein|nr:flagellar brake protein [Kangiellaceae bacterium]
MRFSELGLKMGDVMHLQVAAESETRYPVKLLGYISGSSVMISAPKDPKGNTIFLKEDQVVTLRFVVNNVASGFSAQVMKSNTSPVPYAHIEMPQHVEAIEVRNAVRVNTDIVATIINETHGSHIINVTVDNLSVIGGRFCCDKKVALIGDSVSLTMTLKLDDMDKVVTLNTSIRNKGKVKPSDGDETASDSNWYGFNFDFEEDEDRLLLKAFVYQEILRSLHLL